MRDRRSSRRDSDFAQLRALTITNSDSAPMRTSWAGITSIIDGTCQLFGIRGRQRPVALSDQRRQLALGVQRILRQRMRSQAARKPSGK